MHLSNVAQHHDLPIPLGLIGQQPTSGKTSMGTDNNNTSRNNKILKILVADDSKTERMRLKQVLEGVGYEITTAASGSEALTLISSNAPDLVLLDIIMEDGDGYQTCRALKRNPETNPIPVIMISSKSNDVDRKWAMKLGALDYIVKPYSDTTLLQRLSDI